MKYSSLPLSLAAIVSLLLSTATVQVGAQTPDPSRDEETVVLNPFMVTTDQDVGYLAANSLAGSRLNTSLKDIAASVSVFTEEFLSDIGAMNFEEAAVYATNIEFDYGDSASSAAPNMNQSMDSFQGFRSRGLPTTRALNYFQMSFPTDNFNVGRIEDARGPNSILFGIAQAGGLINAVTKQPMLQRSFRKGTLMVGSYDSYRATIDLNQVAVNGKLGFRFNAVYGRINSYRYYIYDENRRVHLAAKYAFSPRTTIRAEYEGGIIRGNLSRPFGATNYMLNWDSAGRPLVDSPKGAATGTTEQKTTYKITYMSNEDSLLNLGPVRLTSGDRTVITDPRYSDPSINPSGPGTTRYADYDTLSVYFEQRIGRKSFLELAYNYQDSKNDSMFLPATSVDLLGDPNKFLPNGQPNPYAGRLYMEGLWARLVGREKATSYRSILSTQIDVGRWGSYNLVGLGEYRDHRFTQQGLGQFLEGAPFNATPDNAANAVFARNYITEGDFSTYHVGSAEREITNMVDPISGKTLTSVWITRQAGQQQDVPDTIKSLMVAMQARYFSNRLIASLGWRQDTMDSIDRPVATTRDPVTNRLVVNYEGAVDKSYTGQTRTLGLVGHLTQNISLLANYATNLGLPTGARLIGGRLAPAREGVGKDIGMALTLFDGRVYGRAVYYETAGTNLIQNVAAMATSNEAVLQAALAANLITPAEAAARSLGDMTSMRRDLSSHGSEFQITGNLTQRWRIMGNFSITDVSFSNVDPELKAWFTDNFAFWESLPQDLVTPGSSGQTVRDQLNARRDQMDQAYGFEGKTNFGNRRYKVSTFTRYGFDSGVLNGFSIGGGYFHQSKMVVGASGVGTDHFEYEYGNSFWRADLMFGYDVRRLSRNMKLRLQLNIMNVFNKTDPIALRYQKGALYRIVQVDPRQWRLTASLDF